MSSIDVLIVEAHHHCLEHIHALLRKKKIIQPWSMLHFDAHPDLACPTVPAKACFTPRQVHDNPSTDDKNLYELLDSTASGIAEWILPLVLAAQLQTIDWIKPSFSKQLPCGHHRYQVGVIDPSTNKIPTHFWDLSPHARLKVDYNHPYYLDDDSVVTKENLALPQTVDLHITELHNEEVPVVQLSKLLQQKSQPWILDICLDYFACWNPYLGDIDKVDSDVTDALLKVMLASSCFQHELTETNNPPVNHKYPEHYRKNVQDFRCLLQQALKSEDLTTQWVELSQFYSSSEECYRLVEKLHDRIRYNGHHVLDLVLEAIPFWNMPHIPLLDQPEIQIHLSIQRIEGMLRELLYTAHRFSRSVPFLITIARSTSDGFTPPQVVEQIQESVMQMLHRVFCDGCHADCSLRLTKDYGEWEGSTI